MKELNNQKYIVKYYDSYQQKDPLNWKLIIKGPEKSPYKNIDIHFKINFRHLKFNDLASSTYIKTKIYHLNFNNYLDSIPFKYDYNSNLSFYQNLKNYFDFLYDLFVRPKTDIWVDQKKLDIFNNYPDKYEYFASNNYSYTYPNKSKCFSSNYYNYY